MSESNRESEQESTITGRVERAEKNENQTTIHANILAQYTQYLERPDLFLKALEEAVPGSTKEIVERTIEMEKKEQETRFQIAKFQAYISLILQLVGGISSIALADHPIAGILSTAIFYSVTQSGFSGFNKIVC